MALSLIDSSVWIDWFRGVDSKATEELAQLIRYPLSIATTQPVLMELQAGARTVELVKISRIVNSFTMLDVDASIDFVRAADIFRAVRAKGHTPRALLDCLIAAVALRREAVLVHKDIDFDRIAEVVPALQVRSLI
ncbi:MAG TPA: PIN domain nuclease [Pseudonocardiaceae bacterium]|nr:PIN domain nuclease [Pseudonocardiaceae bacterium]